MVNNRKRQLDSYSKIGRHVESIGYGLLATGVWLLALLYLGTYIRADLAGLVDAANPFAAENYLPLLAVAPGLTLIWLGRKI